MLSCAAVNPQTGREAATVPPRGGSRHLHALLDAIFPGLGHLVAGRRRRAALFGLPVLAVLLGVIVALASSSIGGLLGIARQMSSCITVCEVAAPSEESEKMRIVPINARVRPNRSAT